MFRINKKNVALNNYVLFQNDIGEDVDNLSENIINKNIIFDNEPYKLLNDRLDNYIRTENSTDNKIFQKIRKNYINLLKALKISNMRENKLKKEIIMLRQENDILLNIINI